jgi:SAM-dependent methyltransferase
MTSLPGRRFLRRVWRRLETSRLSPLAWRLRLVPATSRERFGRRRAASSWGGLPDRWHVLPRPRAVGSAWPEPPDIPESGAVVRSVYETGARPPVMDLALLETLNEEYRAKPLVREPPQYDQDSREDRARRRLLDVHHAIGLADRRVLEVGCGAGFEVWYLSHHFKADAWGVDVSERRAWQTLADDRTHFVCADLSTDQPFAANSIDRVISFSVLEHVVHPYGVLAELYRIMKPGGLAWISANLHRGPRASHLYREIFFPFPHLLFSDDVIDQFRRKHHGRTEGAVWVNRLSWAQYEDYFREIGFRMRSLRFSETPLDEEFYDRFEDILGRYPRWDLTKDFFYTIVQKPRR